MLLKGAYCVGEHFVDPHRARPADFAKSEVAYDYTSDESFYSATFSIQVTLQFNVVNRLGNKTFYFIPNYYISVHFGLVQLCTRSSSALRSNSFDYTTSRHRITIYYTTDIK